LRESYTANFAERKATIAVHDDLRRYNPATLLSLGEISRGMAEWRNGRRTGLKILGPVNGRAGSSPASATLIPVTFTAKHDWVVFDSQFCRRFGSLMGSLKFHVPGLAEYDQQLPLTAHVVGIEGVPWAGQIRSFDNQLLVQRSIDESGRMRIVWPTLTRGPMMLSTASLRCNEEPYLLQRELARGSLDVLANRYSEWVRWGIQPAANIDELIDNAQRSFVESIVRSDTEVTASVAAQHAIEYELAASRLLCQSYSRQLLTNRMRQEGKLQTLMGARLPFHANWSTRAKLLEPMMNTVWIDASWHHVRQKSGKLDFERLEEQCNWAADRQLRTMAGPLVSLQPHALQEWFYVAEDFDSIVEAACDYAEAVVKQLRGRVHLWYVASGFNSLNDLELTEEQIIVLSVNILEAIRSSDSMTPVVFGIDMPFGEYLGREESAISPIHFADALLRSDLGLNGFALELNYGVWPHGTPWHDAIDLSNLLDLWSTLGIPMILSLSGELTKSNGQPQGKYNPIGNWKLPAPPSRPEELHGLVRQTYGSQMFETIALALAKPSVHGLFWNQPDVLTPPSYPSASLIDTNGNPTDLVSGLTNLRRRHLN
jgi:hypothetical protein